MSWPFQQNVSDSIYMSVIHHCIALLNLAFQSDLASSCFPHFTGPIIESQKSVCWCILVNVCKRCDFGQVILNWVSFPCWCTSAAQGPWSVATSHLLSSRVAAGDVEGSQYVPQMPYHDHRKSLVGCVDAHFSWPLDILVSSYYDLHLFQQSQPLSRFVPSLHLELSVHEGALHVSLIGSSRWHATGTCFILSRPSKREPLQESCKTLSCCKKMHQGPPICTKCWNEKVSWQEHITSQRSTKPNHNKQKFTFLAENVLL